MENYKRLMISLPRGLAERAKEYSYNSGRTFSGLVRVCLERELSHSSEELQPIEKEEAEPK